MKKIGKKVYVNAETERNLVEGEEIIDVFEEVMIALIKGSLNETFADELDKKGVEYLIENIKGDTEMVMDFSIQGPAVDYLEYLKEKGKKVKIVTGFGSAEMDDIYLHGVVDYVGSNYITLKDAYINNNVDVRGTYFSLKNLPGEAIIFEQDMYSLYVLDENKKSYNIDFNLQGRLKIKAKDEEELKRIFEEKISKIEELLKPLD